ncbi:MAG: RNA 3'-terminal phosphate cyclase [Planctomycetota bacterium]|jgi:RNA 3'-terminal phosphate cyclase (ATP)
MIEVDGAQKSGSGTIVRDAVSLSVLVGQELHVTNIRAKRDKPGLRPQHLRGVEACSQICQGKLEGAKVGSREIRFRPGERISGGDFNFDIGTAGSTTMLASILLPLSLFAKRASAYTITGGLFQDFAPSAYHLKYVLFPVLRKMGVDAGLQIIQPGYVPSGKGVTGIRVEPQRGRLRPIVLLEQGNIREIRGIALSSLLEGRKVSERMAKECHKRLKAKRYDARIEIVYDGKAGPAFKKVSIQAGAALAIWAETTTGCLIGSDMAGEPRRTAEFIGKQVARKLIEDLETGATVDRHLADQLIPFCALADGVSEYLIPRMTEHVETRLWLVEKILGAKTEVRNNHLRVKGIGYLR